MKQIKIVLPESKDELKLSTYLKLIEIQIDGKKIVPLYALMNEDKGFCKNDIEVYGYESLKVSVYELLLKWHFDIFDLISKGHAVNINDIKFQL